MTSLRLFLMRHGKSDWSAASGLDRDRPLAERGIQTARAMGEFLARSDQCPDLVISSTAIRARSTAELFIEGAGGAIPYQESEQFYESSPQQVLNEIQSIESARAVMIVGHQPTWSLLASLLIGGGELAFPTATIARVDFDCDRWSEIRYGDGYLKWFLQPKLITNRGEINA